MNATRKVKLKDITANLTCKLCLGYLVDATTIIECLHSFCKSCILKYLEKSADLEEKYCPVCDVQLHSTKPLTSIRSDLMLQEIVYKLVPGLFKNEMCRRREFYQDNTTMSPNNQLDSGQVFDEFYITSDDILYLSLEYVTDDMKVKESTRRFLKCPAAVSIFILKKLLRGKYDLESEAHIDVMFGERILPDDFLLMDIAYKYSWTMNGSKPLPLRYRIKDVVKPVIKSEVALNDNIPVVEPVNPITRSETQISANTKKVCNENGSNIMPSSEEIKIPPVKHPGNGLIPGAILPPIKASEGKPRGRKRKHLKLPTPNDDINESKAETKNAAKRSKLQKVNATQSPISVPTPQPQMTAIAKDVIQSSANKEVKEVQLQISENGVMSALRVISPSVEEKIIMRAAPPVTSTSPNSTPSPPSSHDNIAEKLLLSGNFNAKTGVTEIICNNKPDPTCVKTSTAKPGYVTLNIPNPGTPMLHNNRFQNANLGNKTPNKLKKKTNGMSPTTSNIGIPNGIGDSKSAAKSNLMKKLKSRIASKGSDGDNVIKAITDLGKLCNGTTSSPGPGDLSEVQTAMGTHTPISTTLANQFQLQQRANKGINGLGNPSVDGFPLGLNFSPASGMSVSMIPCTGSNPKVESSKAITQCSSTMINATSLQTTNNTPPKRSSHHQTIVINGDLKFTSSPKQVTAHLTNGSQDGSPKRPPKFFKSRHALSPAGASATSSSTSKPTSPKPDNDLKRKISKYESSQKKAKERKVAPKASGLNNSETTPTSQGMIVGKNLGSSSSAAAAIGALNGGQGSYPLAYQTTSINETYSQHLNALNSLAANSAESQSFGMAAAAASVAASNVNGLSFGMVPFVTENYCSMPFLNQRHPMTQYDFLLNFPGVAALANIGQLGQAVTSVTNSSVILPKQPKNIAPATSAGNQSRILNDLLIPKASIQTSSGGTLDLSTGKKGKNGNKKDDDSNKQGNGTPLLARLLFNKDSSPTGNGDGPKIVSAGIPKRDSKEENTSTSDSSPSKNHNDQHNGSKTVNGQVCSKDKLKSGDISGFDVNKSKQERLEKILSNGISSQERKRSISPKQIAASGSDESRIKVNGESEIKLDSCSSTTNNTTGMSLAKEKLLCLSAQNNNNNNNHETTSGDSSSSDKTSSECANSKGNDEKKTTDSANVTVELAAKLD